MRDLQLRAKTHKLGTSLRFFNIFQIILVMIVLIFSIYATIVGHFNEMDEKPEPSKIIPINDQTMPSQYATSTNSQPRSRGDFDKWGMTNFQPLNLDDPDKTTIYPGYKEYKFRSTVSNFDVFKFVTSVSIEIPDEFKNYTWSRSGRGVSQDNSRTTGSDYSAGFYKISSELGYLDFNITFPWTGSNTNDIHDWNIYVIENNTKSTKVPDSIAYSVVRTVKFSGTLKVKGEHQGTLKENDWVRKKENITWTGLRIIYDSPQSLVPPRSQCEIVLSDNDVDFWYDESNYGEEMRIISTADSNNDYSDEHELGISGSAETKLLESITFKIGVDADGIGFYNATPKDYEWQNITQITCGIDAYDVMTSGVNSDSIDFNFSKDNGKTWSGWVKPKVTEKPNHIKCSGEVNFKDGEKNLIKWRGY
jgi:hypothetical protein